MLERQSDCFQVFGKEGIEHAEKANKFNRCRDCHRIVVNYSSPGSAIIFDYLNQAVLEGIQRQSEVENMCRFRFMTGEGLTFGIPEGEVEAFLKVRGFRQVRDVSLDELKVTYFAGKNAHRKVAGGYGIVIAKV